MPQVEHTITINRPVGEVFRLVADFRNDPQWQKDVVEVHQTEGSTRIGTMVTEKRNLRVWTWRLDLNVDVVDYQPNKLIEIKGVIGQFPVLGRYEFSFSRGTTQFTQSFDIRMGFLYGVFSPFLRGAVLRRTRNSMDALKQLLEARGSSGISPIPQAGE